MYSCMYYTNFHFFAYIKHVAMFLSIKLFAPHSIDKDSGTCTVGVDSQTWQVGKNYLNQLTVLIE